jgi:glutamate-ammonia-ligase adenylyltransferase
MGHGGLADIEWCAQWLAMKHGAIFPPANARDAPQLNAARDAELLSSAEWQALDAAYTWLRRAELRLQIAREGGAALAKRGSAEAALWARAVFPGLENGVATARFESEWRAHTSRARAVFERVRDEL